MSLCLLAAVAGANFVPGDGEDPDQIAHSPIKCFGPGPHEIGGSFTLPLKDPSVEIIGPDGAVALRLTLTARTADNKQWEVHYRIEEGPAWKEDALYEIQVVDQDQWSSLQLLPFGRRRVMAEFNDKRWAHGRCRLARFYYHKDGRGCLTDPYKEGWDLPAKAIEYVYETVTAKTAVRIDPGRLAAGKRLLLDAVAPQGLDAVAEPLGPSVHLNFIGEPGRLAPGQSLRAFHHIWDLDELFGAAGLPTDSFRPELLPRIRAQLALAWQERPGAPPQWLPAGLDREQTDKETSEGPGADLTRLDGWYTFVLRRPAPFFAEPPYASSGAQPELVLRPVSDADGAFSLKLILLGPDGKALKPGPPFNDVHTYSFQANPGECASSSYAFRGTGLWAPAWEQDCGTDNMSVPKAQVFRWDATLPGAGSVRVAAAPGAYRVKAELWQESGPHHIELFDLPVGEGGVDLRKAAGQSLRKEDATVLSSVLDPCPGVIEGNFPTLAGGEFYRVGVAKESAIFEEQRWRQGGDDEDLTPGTERWWGHLQWLSFTAAALPEDNRATLGGKGVALSWDFCGLSEGNYRLAVGRFRRSGPDKWDGREALPGELTAVPVWRRVQVSHARAQGVFGMHPTTPLWRRRGRARWSCLDCQKPVTLRLRDAQGRERWKAEGKDDGVPSMVADFSDDGLALADGTYTLELSDASGQKLQSSVRYSHSLDHLVVGLEDGPREVGKIDKVYEQFKIRQRAEVIPGDGIGFARALFQVVRASDGVVDYTHNERSTATQGWEEGTMGAHPGPAYRCEAIVWDTLGNSKTAVWKLPAVPELLVTPTPGADDASPAKAPHKPRPKHLSPKRL